MMYDPQREQGYETTSGSDPDLSELLAQLRSEYKRLLEILRKQGRRRDPALLMRLMIVSMDLGIYRPSPP